MRQIRHRHFNLVIVAASLITIAGCGTLSNGGKQSVYIQTLVGNKLVHDANCNLKNRAGSWQVSSSNDIVLEKSAGELVIECLSKDKKYAGRTIVSSETNSSMWASIVTVGVGAVVDAASGAGFDYPSNIIVLMKEPTLAERDMK